MKHENEMKEEAREKKGDLLDSITMTLGTAGKGGSIAIKAYVNLLDVSKEGEPDTDTELKIANLQKVRQKMISDGLVLG